MSLAAGRRQFITHLEAFSEDAISRPKPVTTLTDAATRGDVDLIAVFLDNGEDIEQRSVGFASPLAAAASAGYIEAVKYLLSRGASLNPPGAMFPLLHFPITNRRTEIIEYLLLAGTPKEPHRPLFRLMAHDKYWDIVDAMLAGCMDPEWLSEAERAGYDAWRRAEGPRDAAWLDARHAKEMERLVQMEQRMRKGRRLSDADRQMHEEAAIALLAQYGTPLATGSLASGTTFLAQAVTVKSPKLTAILLKHGALPNPVGSAAQKPLVRAAEVGDVEAMRGLVEAGAEPIPEACVAAAASGCLAGLEFLLASGAKLLAKHRKEAIAAVAGPFARQIRAVLEKKK